MGLFVSQAMALALLTVSLCWSQFLGPADITLTRLEKCDEDRQGMIVEYSMKKLNRTAYVINAYGVLPFELGENVAANFTAAKWGDGGYKPNYLDLYDPNICDFIMKYGKEKFERLMDNMNIEKKCPVPANTYNITNFLFGSDTNLTLPYGDFRLELRMIKDNEIVTCFRAFMKVDPKKGAGPLG